MPAQLGASALPGTAHEQMQQGCKGSAPPEATWMETRNHVNQPSGSPFWWHTRRMPCLYFRSEPWALSQTRILKMRLFHEIKQAVGPFASLQLVSTGVPRSKICLSKVLEVQRRAPWHGQRQSEGSQPWGPPQHPSPNGNPHSARLMAPRQATKPGGRGRRKLALVFRH